MSDLLEVSTNESLDPTVVLDVEGSPASAVAAGVDLAAAMYYTLTADQVRALPHGVLVAYGKACRAYKIGRSHV